MDIKQIEELVKLIENSGLTEFSYTEGDVEIVMSKLDNAPVVAPASIPMPMGMPMAAAPAVVTNENDASAIYTDMEEYITSPIVGTFYSAPSPDAPAYVRVGDKVKSGQVVCILEAMKLMNEIQCDYDCEIEAVLVSNEQKVDYGQPLFRVKKL